MRSVTLLGLYVVCVANEEECCTYCELDDQVLCCKSQMDGCSQGSFFGWTCGPDGTEIEPGKCQHVTTTQALSTPTPPGHVGSLLIIGVVVVIVLGVLALSAWYLNSRRKRSSQRLLTPALATQALHGLDPETATIQRTEGEQHSSNAKIDENCDVFLSLRFTNSDLKDYAKHLKNDLDQAGHKVFLCAADVGERFGPKIATALQTCKYFIPLVTLDPMYGEDTGGSYSTFHELRLAGEYQKTICPVMMYKDKWSWPPTQLVGALNGSARNGCNAGSMIGWYLNPGVSFVQSADLSEQSAHVVAKKLLQSMHE